jgi:hypothetical protein
MSEAGGLTGVLLHPIGESTSGKVLETTSECADALRGLAALRRGGPIRLTDHHIRLALAAAPIRPTPFAWSARTARRGLGLAALRSLVDGSVRSPIEGVRLQMAQAMRVSQGQRPTSSLEQWLSSLPVAGRAMVAAEASTWVTPLWTALDWSAFDERPLIGRDHWWDSPNSALLGLRSRAEVRSTVRDAEGRVRSVHLVVLGGARRPSSRAELSVVALVEALRRQTGIVPGRVVGWWPESGHHVRLDVDDTVLRQGVDTVSRALLGVPEGAAA